MIMKELYEYPIFRGNISTVKETSYDDRNNEYLIDNDTEVIDFDMVKKNLLSNMGLPEEGTKSVDALMCQNGRCIFIEFKNDKISGSIKKDIRIKAADSCLIYSEITSTKWSDNRVNSEFILVYSEEKNASSVEDQNRKYISSHVMGLACREMIYFEMSKLKGYHFFDVHTYNEKDFVSYLQRT